MAADVTRRSALQLTGAAFTLPVGQLDPNRLENGRMAFTPKFVDLVRNVATVSGTGPVTLGAAVNGYTSLADAVSTGEQFYYCVQGVDKPQEREVGRGTMQADGKVAREAIVGGLTNFTGGTKTIALVASAEWFARLEQLGNGTMATVASRSELAAKAAGRAYLAEDGRAGIFLFDPTNLAAKVSADPNQGIYVAPSSASSGENGAWVRQYAGPVNVRWFGAVGDDVADDGPAFTAAIAYLRSIAVAGPYSSGSPTLFVPFGKYYLGTTTLNISHTITIEGEGTGDAGGNGTVLRWAGGTTGIRVQAYNTSGASTVDTVTHPSGAASIIKRLMLKGGYAGTESEHHGIHLKARAIIRDCYIDNFPGDGIHGWAAAGAGDATEGNINSFHIEKVWISGCRNGLFLKGADANAGNVIALSANYNRQWGAWDGSFLGNSYVGLHADGNGMRYEPSLPTAIVSHNGNRYYVKLGQAVGASTNPPTGTSADNSWWGYHGVGGPTTNIPAWSSGMPIREGGPNRTDNANAASVFIGCYSELGQAPAQFTYPTLILGGQLAAGVKGSGVWLRNSQGHAEFDKVRINGDFFSFGNQSFIGPSEGTAADNSFSFRNSNYYNNLFFESYLGGAQSLDGAVTSARGFGLILKGFPSLELRHGPTNATIASVGPGSFDLASGKTLKVGGIDVVGARRSGWATATGSATRSSFDTSTVTTAQLAERVKALIDDLAAHGLIGS